MPRRTARWPRQAHVNMWYVIYVLASVCAQCGLDIWQFCMCATHMRVCTRAAAV